MAMTNPVIDSPEVWRHFVHVLLWVCDHYQVAPGLIFCSRHKKEPIAQARAVMAAWLRQTLAHEAGSLVVYAKGLPTGYRPISWPELGAMLGCDHSALILATQALNTAEHDALAQVIREGCYPTECPLCGWTEDERFCVVKPAANDVCSISQT